MKRLWMLALAATLAIPVCAQEHATTQLLGSDGEHAVAWPAPPPGDMAFGHFGPPPPPPFQCGGPEILSGHMLPAFMMHEMTDAQVEEMVQQRREYLTNDAPKKLKIEQLHFDMEDALSQPTVDKVKIMDLSSRINALRSELAGVETERRIKIAESLTPEQRKKMRRALLAPPPPPPGAMMFKMRGHEGGPGEHGPMHPPSPSSK